MDELLLIEADLRKAESAFDDLASQMADSQDASERHVLLQKLDVRQAAVQRLRSELRLCAQRLKP